MKITELLLAALAHVFGLALVIAIVAKFQMGDPDIAWVAAAVFGTLAGAIPYHKRHAEKATSGAKATLGAVLGMLSVVEGVLVLVVWHYRPNPEVVIPITAVGTFVFPFVLFGPVQKGLEQSKKKT
jgi:hypothetical protein